MWGVSLLWAASTGALLTGTDVCGEAAKKWNRYAPTSNLNGLYTCSSNTVDDAFEELANQINAQSLTKCAKIEAVVRALDNNVVLNVCNTSAACGNKLTCFDDPVCSYCVPAAQTNDNAPCFQGGAIKCTTLLVNSIAAGAASTLALLGIAWTNGLFSRRV